MSQSATTTSPSAATCVLVVDDDSTFADALVSLLFAEGLTATAVYSGPEAIASALRSAPDFIVMDVVMDRDGIDGVDAAIAICETAPIPCILLMSGHPRAEERLAKASARGHVFELLAKPIQFAMLLQRLRDRENHSTHRAA